MRINRFVAMGTGMSRRAADRLVEAGKIIVNGQPAELGQEVTEADEIVYEGKKLTFTADPQLIMLNKPADYVVSRDGQGSKTIYELLPTELHSLKPVGRLDKDSSGLLLLTNDGQLANQLTHPSFQKEKIYEVALDKPLAFTDKNKIEQGVELEDGLSRLTLHGGGQKWQAGMHEGRNRQIRRTFATLGYQVVRLHRISFGNYQLADLAPGTFISIAPQPMTGDN